MFDSRCVSAIMLREAEKVTGYIAASVRLRKEENEIWKSR